MTQIRVAKKTPGGLSLDVDFPILPGGTALYGPSGAGKSLLLELIAGFAAPDSGRILLDDAILFDAAARVAVPPRRRSIGFVFQTLALFPPMTLERNLAFAAKGRPRLERHRRVSEMLELFDLAPAAALRPHQASADQKRRCAVARALIGEPRLLLIDDAGVDEPLLARIRQRFQNPILLVTGDLDLCSAAAGQLILLQAGRIVQRGAVRAVLDRPESVEAASLLGIANLFEGTIVALDPGRNSSRLDFGAFSLSGPYIPGHFRGDRVSVAVRPEALRVHSGAEPAGENFVAAPLVRVSERARYVRMEFEGGIFADIRRDEYVRQKDNQDWRIEFPAGSLVVL
jgi:molybdate transport system ATP-binding protein